LTLVTASHYSESASRENHEEVVKLSLRLARRQGHHEVPIHGDHVEQRCNVLSLKKLLHMLGLKSTRLSSGACSTQTSITAV